MASTTPKTSKTPKAARYEPVHVHEDSIVMHVPVPLRITAALSWRLIVVGIVLWAFVSAFSTLAPILLPMIIALLIAAPLERVVTRLKRHGVPRGLGAIIAILLLLGSFAALSVAAGSALISGFDSLRKQAERGFEEFLDWLSTGPLNLDRTQIDEGIEGVTQTAQDNAWGLASGALSVTGTLGALVAGVIISLIALFFFLRDGRQMWLWVAGLLPGDDTTHNVDRAGIRAWNTLRRYTQTSVFVAFVDAVGIGGVAWLLGVPLALPIAILTFVTAFIPLIGATIAGLVAVMIALVDGGWTTALLMLAGIFVVQQIEGNILYPWLFGKAASIHPFVILTTISAGTLLAGLVGAVLAVPILATLYTFFTGLREEYGPEEEAADTKPITTQIPILAKRGKTALKSARARMTRTGENPVKRGKAD